MKKIFIFLITFLIALNVNAMTCTYSNVGVSLDVNVNMNVPWIRAYTFGGSLYGNLNDDKNLGTSGKVIAPNLTKFNRYASMIGSVADEGVCPVLVSIGGDQYTLMPYRVYTTYFSRDVSIDCSDCNDDVIRATGIDGVTKRYTFADVCNYFKGNRTFIAETVPLLTYMYENPDHEDFVAGCEDFINGNGGMVPDWVLKDYFMHYNEEIVPGEVYTNSEYSTCPTVNDFNETDKILNCLSEKNNYIKQVISDFSSKCTEREKRAIQLYSGGSVANFYDKHGVSGYLDNEIKMLFDSFSSDCASAADKLYNSVNNVNRVINAYGFQSNIQNTIIFLNLETNYMKAYGLLTSMNFGVDVKSDACNLIPDYLRNIIKELLDIVRIVGTILVILLSIVEVYKALTAGDEKVKSKMFSMITKRIIALVVLLILPVLVLGIIDLLNKYIGSDTSKCVISDIK